MQTWRQQLAIIQEWSGVARACIPSGLLFLTYLHYFVGIAFLLFWDEAGTVLNRDATIAAIPMFAFWMAGGVLITLLGLALRLRAPEAVWFQYLSAIFYSLSQVWGGYMVGSLSFVIGIVLTGAPLVGFILLGRRVTLAATGVAFLAILASNLGAAYGLLPYAPFFRTPHDAQSAVLWTHAQFFFAAPHIVSVVLLSSLILGHWRKREEAVLMQSLTDALTGVHNRRSILDLLDTELSRCRRHGSTLAVVLLDLDHFKKINDTHGHATGDRVLQEAAQALRGCMRQCDEIGRFGGEEFLLLLPETSREGAALLAERCRQRLEQLVVSADNGATIALSGSLGVACSEGAAPLPADVLVREADAALYAAKQGGRNRVVFAAPAAAGPDAEATLATASAPTGAAPPWQGRLSRLSTVPGADFLHHIDGAPWWRRLEGWRRLLAGTREWTPVAKVGLVLFLLVMMQWGGLLWLVYVLQRSDAATLVNVAYGRQVAWGMAAGIAATYVLLLAAIWLRKRHPDARWFQHLGLHYYSMTLLVLGYVLGIMYLPTGVIFACSPVVGFILFRRNIVLPVWAVALVTITVLAYACALHWIPYAPLISLAGPAWHVHSPFWVYTMYLFYVPTLLIMLVLVDQVLGRWREREAQIHAINLTDALTQVHNRRSILERLETELQRSARTGQPLTVALLDLDHFKRINDTWGHPTGDRVLQEAARVLKESMREGDLVGRYGGEEFLLLLPDTALEGALVLLERCRARLAATVITAEGGSNFFISASFGVTCNAAWLEAPADVLTRVADDALYRAKAGGRNRVEVLALAGCAA